MTASSRSAGLLSGFGLLRPVAVAACGYAVAAVVWLVFGDALPGGRWFAVHLFTVGILSNLVVALTEHFGRTLQRAGPPGQRLTRFVALNVGALTMLGFPPHLRVPFAVGAIVLAATVLWLALDLRRMRRGAPETRFAYVLLAYEWACIAFLLGALLGALMGLGGVRGPWYGAARLAHLHVNILGWGGLTLLATVVFLGPAMMRTRMEGSADRLAPVGLRLAAGGLLLTAGGLLASGVAGVGAVWPDLVAAAGLLTYAVGAALIITPLLRAGRSARPSAQSWMIQAAAAWFVVAVAADAVVIGTGRLRLLDALGAVLIAGVLGQAILAVLNHLTPMLWATGAAGRARVRDRAETWAPARIVALNAGVLAVLVAGVAGPGGGAAATVAARTGWTMVGLVVLVQVVLIGRDAGPALIAGLRDARGG